MFITLLIFINFALISSGKTKFSMASCNYIIRVTLNTEFDTFGCLQVTTNPLDQSLQIIPWQTEGVLAIHPNGVSPLFNASK